MGKGLFVDIDLNTLEIGSHQALHKVEVVYVP